MSADKQAYIYPQIPMTVFVIWLRKVTEKIERNTAKHRVNKAWEIIAFLLKSYA